MAFSDWDLLLNNNCQHSAILNSTVTPGPLTTGSSYCRRVNLGATNNGDGGGMMWGLKTTFSGGAFYGIQNSKAIRIQSNLRLDTAPDTNTLNGLFMCAKSTVFNKFTGSRSCYALGIKSYGGGLYKKCLLLNNVNPTDLGAASLDTWYSFRMEIYPIGTTADVVKCYEETSPGNWSLLANITISSTSADYVPWDNNRITGFFINQDSQYVSGGPIAGYIDNFSASVANAPTPIP